MLRVATSFVARLRLRRRRGAALFETMLALMVLGVVAVYAMVFLDDRRQARLAEEAGRQVAILGHAAAHYALTHYADNTAWPAQLSFGNPADPLHARGILPVNFSATDAMKRGLRVWYQRIGTHPNHTSIRILAGQHGLGGDARVPLRALYAGGGRVRTGIVRTGADCRSPLLSPCLLGPAIAESLDWASPTPEEHAVMAFRRVTREEYCGDLVLRAHTDVCPESGRIMGDLDMGGGSPAATMPNHDVRNVGTLAIADPGPDGVLGTADDPTPASGREHELAVREDMTVIGAFTLDMTAEGEGLGVGRDADVTGQFTARGMVGVYGDVRVGRNLTIDRDFEIHGDLDVTRRIDGMAVINVTGDMDVEGSAEGLNVQRLYVNPGGCPNCVK